MLTYFRHRHRGDYAPPTQPTQPAIVGPHNWKMIATDYLGDQRSDVQCLHRWQKVLQPGLVKGPWTKVKNPTAPTPSPIYVQP